MGLEDFLGLDDNSGMDNAAFERFKEKMKRAAAQIKAIKREETKRKKKEEELVRIILKFIKTSSKKDLVLLISRVLERNIPANFILSIILLGNEEIKRDMEDYLALKGGQSSGASTSDSTANANSYSNTDGTSNTASSDEKSLIFFREDETIPLKARIEIDKWVKDVIFQASEIPQKLIKTAYEITYEKTEDGENKEIKTVSKSLILLVAHIIFNYLNQNGIEADIVKLKEFSEFLIRGILNKTEEELGMRREIQGTVEDPTF